MTISSLPETAADAYASARFGLKPNTVSHVSDLDGSTQTLRRPGERWLLDAVLTVRTRAQAEAWIAWLVDLNGTAGRFYAGDPLGATARGTAGGGPLVKGASQTGKALAIDNGPLSETGWLLVGDYFAVDLPSGGRSLHKLTAQANTDGSGEATLAFAPALRESPADNAALILSAPSCVMRLIDDDQARWDVEPGDVWRIAFAAIESFNQGGV